MSATTYYSPSGNPEVWVEKPTGYFTVEEWQDAHPSPPPIPPTSEQLFISLRTERDTRLYNTDKYLLPDYPISPEALEAIKVYRQLLRDIPAQPGAPWDGGGDETPWPLPPEI